ncbi:MAG: tRNA (adenosine(37)-N6)-dimethylallyltransferase MiaA [Verrucomicrobiota bacterium]|jgi:tRNA dimethylallyltransferase
MAQLEVSMSTTGPMPAEWAGHVILIGGATGVGKTEAILEAAQRWGAEVVVADSMQVYCGLDIGTAKPTSRELARVPHYGIDLVDFRQDFSVLEWLGHARRAASEILARGCRVIVAGGTGMYLKAFAVGLSSPLPDHASEEWWAEVRGRGLEENIAALLRLDPEAGRWIDLANARRVERALEQVTVTGRSLGMLRAQWTRRELWPQRLPLLVFDRESESLRQRQRQRLEAMLAAGWVGEVMTLREQGYGPGMTAFQALGYREIWAALEAGDWPGAWPEKIAVRTWRYARRQRTWFRHQMPGRWMEPWKLREIPRWEAWFE